MSPLLQRADELALRLRLRVERPLLLLRLLLASVALLSLVVLAAVRLGPGGMAALALWRVTLLHAFVAQFVLELLLAPHRDRFLRERPLRLLAGIAGALSLALGASASGGEGFSARAALFLVHAELFVDAGQLLWKRGIAAFKPRPTALVAASFFALIVIGAGLLLSERAVPEDPALFLRPIDALFTSTSAVCVTGLVVRDTGAGFTTYGQGVILALIQFGGLGIMTLAAFFATAIGGGLSTRDRVLIGESLQAGAIGGLTRMLVAILAVTLVIEGLGALLLYHAFPERVESHDRLFYAVFHAISAYCNAGFAFHPDNVMRYRHDLGILAVLAFLLVAGGLGFVVFSDLATSAWRIVRRALTSRAHLRRRIPPPQLSLQTQVVLKTSAFLGVAGAVLIGAYDWSGRAFEGLTPLERVSNAVFASLTCRTAGFNAVDVALHTHGTLFVMIALMYVGGSPGSTAGGIKTTTLAIIHSRLLGLLRHREEIEIGRRTIPRAMIANAIGVAWIAAGAIFVATCLLLFTDAHLTLEQALFEVVSAFSTVGLSTGITPGLSDGGKLVLIVAMFAGRIGPLTLVLALAERAGSSATYRYPNARMMIG